MRKRLDIRVSVAGICRITTPNRRFILLANHSTYRRTGNLVYTPVGGALHVSTAGRLTIESLGGYGFESEDDLRFRLPVESMSKLTAWLIKGQDYEVSALREFTEELVEETGILDTSDIPNDITFAGYQSALTFSARANGAQTRLIALVWNISLGPIAIQKLLEATTNNPPLIGIFSREEILERRGLQKQIIGAPISEFLLNPSLTIPLSG